MSALSTQTEEVSQSAIQTLIHAHRNANEPDRHLHHLALQIAHCLRFQHDWTDLRIHRESNNASQFPRPLISGLPPRRLYVHPDEQIELLQKQKDAGKSGLPDLVREREWALPSHLRERWTLRRFGEIFDAIDVVPPPNRGEEVIFERGRGAATPNAMETMGISFNKWRSDQPKRLLLATLDDDSTVMFYIVHDGVVKPRQN